MSNVINMIPSYEKYSGDVRYNPINKPSIKYNQNAKKYYINKFNKNSDVVIDIGSGKGKDLPYWIEANIKYVIGIEPSLDSMLKAIKRYKNERNKIRITYLNGIGNKIWNNGEGALREEDKQKFMDLFQKIKANSINMCFTIHYMMDTRKDFNNLLQNIDDHIQKNGKIIILFMDGARMHKLLKKHNGEYIIKNKEEIVFKCTAKYDYNNNKIKIFGSRINVFFLSVTGLENSPDENLVLPTVIKKIFESHKYELIEDKRLSSVDPEGYVKLEPFQKKIVDLYRAIVFKK